MKRLTARKLTRKLCSAALALPAVLVLGTLLGAGTASVWAAPAAIEGSATTAPASATAGVAAAPAALDPAMQRLFMTLAMSVLSNFATHAARGSLDAFDPGPAIESALKGALNSRDLNAVIDRLVAQAGAGSEASGASPELRAMLKAALTGVVAMARSEIARQLSDAPSGSGAGSAPTAAPLLNP